MRDVLGQDPELGECAFGDSDARVMWQALIAPDLAMMFVNDSVPAGGGRKKGVNERDIVVLVSSHPVVDWKARCGDPFWGG